MFILMKEVKSFRCSTLKGDKNATSNKEKCIIHSRDL